MRLFGSKIEKKMHRVHSNSSNTNEQIKRHLYFSRMAQQRGFRQRNCCRALANREKSRVVWVPRNDPVETSTISCLAICRRAFGVAAMVLPVYENEIQASCFFVSVSSSKIVATLHIAFSWLPLPIAQEILMQCSLNLAPAMYITKET